MFIFIIVTTALPFVRSRRRRRAQREAVAGQRAAEKPT